MNLASRLCNKADAMTVNITEEIMHAANHSSELQFVTPERTQIRGINNEVMIYRLRWAAENTMSIA